MENHRHLIALANRENAEVETFHVKRDIMSVRIFNNELADAQNTVEEGAGIRIAKDGRIGFSSTNNLSRDSLEKSFTSALNMAKRSRSIPGWLGFPAQQDTHSKIYGQAPHEKPLATMTTEETVDLALRMIKQAASRSKIACALTGSLITLLEEFSVMNSTGLEHEFEASSTVNTRIIIEARMAENYCTTEGQFCSRRLSDFNPEEEVDKVVSRASELLKLTR